MRHSLRLTATWAGALVLTAQAGCALTPEAGGVNGPWSVRAYNASLTPAPVHPLAAGSVAWPTDYVALHETGPGAAVDGGIPRYSNVFVSETKEGQPAGLFVSADYHEWGGFPIYYPYPTTLVSGPLSYRPFGTYGNWRRDDDGFARYHRAGTAAGAPAHSGSAPVSSKGVDVTGGAASGTGGRSGAGGTARAGGTAYSRGYTGSGKSSGPGYRGGPRGVSDAYGARRGRGGATWRSQPR